LRIVYDDLWRHVCFGERMIDRPQISLEETVQVEMTHRLALVSIDELQKLSQIPLFADHLANEKEIRELEKAEAVLSVIITRLRCLQPVKKNQAIIYDLTERLRK
jgi:hypothetical protein